MYDNNGDAFGFKYNGTEYFYVKNLQNDITAITDSAGKVIANYYYDAWGNITSTTGNTTIANTNPLRYRSYYYDTDTKLYYLNTRYYSPDMSRFLNADGYIQTGQGVLDKNMFAYCGNSPTNLSDPSGNSWVLAILIVAAVGLALTGCSVSKTTSNTNEPYSGGANCYAYAMKLEFDPRNNKPFRNKPQPGEFSGNMLTYKDLKGGPVKVKEKINKKVTADTKVLKLNYKEVSSANHTPKQGNWVVALVYASDGSDYHWYRRNEDGTWSHKPGITPIISWDASGNPITDPATCDRGIYDSFLGYYEVGPN